MFNMIFPVIMVLLNLSQMVVKLVSKDITSSIYWLSAAVLNATVAIKQGGWK